MATHPSPLHCTFILHITIDFLSLVCFALLSFSVATWCIIHQPRHKVLFSNSNQSSVSHWAPEILIGGSVAAQVLSDSKLTQGSPPGKKNVFFWALPEKGGGGGPCPNFLTLFSTMFSLIFWHQYHVIWYFLVILNTKIIKSTKIMITIITHIIVVIIVTWFCNTR